MNLKKKKYCLFTFDVEEWFQVENFKSAIKKGDWENKRSSVQQNTRKILDILNEHQVKSTFFILGWIAEKFPQLVENIKAEGHEVASHGYKHDLVNTLGDQEIYDDVIKSRLVLEKIIGEEIIGYRAPSFSVNNNLINVLSDLGFTYDSSYNPFQLNDRYGSINIPNRKVYHIYQLENGLYEIPASTLNISRYAFPISGGAYFRILPFYLFKNLVKYKINKDTLYTFYLHPWELEPGQPRVTNIPFNYRLRHYTGLSNTAPNLEKFILFLKENGCQFMTIQNYINSIVK